MAFIAGIDIGSVTTKCVILADADVKARTLTRTGVDPEKAVNTVVCEACALAGIQVGQLDLRAATGYGRRLATGASKVITEISAAGRGAFALAGGRRLLVLDVGGQDTKLIDVEAGGDIADFLMNDKCAAGTGRFLELMAGVLETDLDGLSSLAFKSSAPITINATCGVFAETEVVSLIAHAAKREDIAAGVMNSIATRIAAMLHSFDPDSDLVFCGGCARSPALSRAIEAAAQRELRVLPDAQHVVALGAALLAAR